MRFNFILPIFFFLHFSNAIVFSNTIEIKFQESLNNNKLPIIEKSFYGSHFDSYTEMPSIELMKELNLGKIRIGGNEFDVYNWKLHKAVNSTGEIKDLLSFEEYAKILKKYQVEGIFQINLFGYQPELIDNEFKVKKTFNEFSAFELIKYLNGKMQLGIKDFALGNEFPIWHETHPKVWNSEDGISADDFIERYIKFVVQIRKAQEENSGNPNDIKIWGPEISTSWYDWNTANFKTDCEWTDVRGQIICKYGNNNFTNKKFSDFIPYFLYRISLAEKNSPLNPKKYKLLDYFSIHYYPSFRAKNSDPETVFKDEQGLQRVADILEATRNLNDPEYINTIEKSSYRKKNLNILNRMNQWLSEFYPDAKLAINEYAIDANYRSNFYHPIIRPLFLADSLGIFANENVKFVNNFLLSTAKGVHLPWNMIEGGERLPNFYTYQLFTNHFLGKVITVTDDFGDIVNSYATFDGNFINLAIINKEPIAFKVNIKIEKKMIAFEIPAWSTSMLKIDKKQFKISKQFSYGAKEMNVPIEIEYKKK